MEAMTKAALFRPFVPFQIVEKGWRLLWGTRGKSSKQYDQLEQQGLHYSVPFCRTFFELFFL